MQVAYYQDSIETFLGSNFDAILGVLTKAHGFALDLEQKGAWIQQIRILQTTLASFDAGYILFEFSVPRMGKRADVVLLLQDRLFILEFKVGATGFDRSAIEQVHDYALDLKNFHRGSHALPIIPILVATAAKSNPTESLSWAADQVASPLLSNSTQLAQLLADCMTEAGGQFIDFQAWIGSGYLPTPTIVEAAQALYQSHGVEEIARSDAGGRNLSQTSRCIATIIEEAKARQQKAICFVTGVPGAGKTLAGLNIATKRAQEHADEHAVFLSGNGPLVIVLREALARDQAARTKQKKSDADRQVASFIQNIHHFRDEALRNPGAPYEKVVVFDEAQRAWNRSQAATFMQKKRGIADFDKSEPEFLISVMDRHRDWCVIVCLVGGGQEINTGEAGLVEWLLALHDHFSHWHVYTSEHLSDPDYVSDNALADRLARLPVQDRPDLHLAVSMRSFRAERVSAFVGHVIEGRAEMAAESYAEFAPRYPIYLTRDIRRAREWLRDKARGSERYGLLASSGAHRLRAEGIHIKTKIDPANWFLNDRSDVRSSFYCEEVGTEFDVQGLELDWAGVCWDADFRYAKGQWASWRFRGTSWQRVKASSAQLYLKNAYRVILTRARQGMIIFVPKGSGIDPTRPAQFYDETFAFLKECGIPKI